MYTDVNVAHIISLYRQESLRVKTVVCTGSEWPYVILSTVRSCSMTHSDINRSSNAWLGKRLGFITDENLVNVAITRAQDGLCILGKD